MNRAAAGIPAIRRKGLDSIVPGRKPIHAAPRRRPHPAVTSPCRRLVAIVVVLGLAPSGRTDGADPVPAADHVTISADFGFETEGRGLVDSSDVVMLRRRVTIRQADTVLTAGQGIVWISRARSPKTGFRVLVYLENNVRLEGPDQTHNRPVLLHELAVSATKPTVRIVRSRRAPRRSIATRFSVVPPSAANDGPTTRSWSPTRPRQSRLRWSMTRHRDSGGCSCSREPIAPSTSPPPLRRGRRPARRWW